MRDSLTSILFTLAAFFCVTFILSGAATWIIPTVSLAIVATITTPAFLGATISALLAVAVNEVNS